MKISFHSLGFAKWSPWLGRLTGLYGAEGKFGARSFPGWANNMRRGMAGNETWIYSYSRTRPHAKRFIPLLGGRSSAEECGNANGDG